MDDITYELIVDGESLGFTTSKTIAGLLEASTTNEHNFKVIEHKLFNQPEDLPIELQLEIAHMHLRKGGAPKLKEEQKYKLYEKMKSVGNSLMVYASRPGILNGSRKSLIQEMGEVQEMLAQSSQWYRY